MRVGLNPEPVREDVVDVLRHTQRVLLVARVDVGDLLSGVRGETPGDPRRWKKSEGENFAARRARARKRNTGEGYDTHLGARTREDVVHVSGKGGCVSTTARRGSCWMYWGVALALRSGSPVRVVMVPPVALEMSRGSAVVDVRVEVRPPPRRHPESSRKEGKDVREVRRRAGSRIRSLAVSRRRREAHPALVRTASHPTGRRDIYATCIRRRETSRWDARWGKCAADLQGDTRDDRLAGGGGRTHQASALGLLAEVVEQRGHVAEALGGIFPVKKERGLGVSDVPSSVFSVPRLPHASVASGSPKNRTRSKDGTRAATRHALDASLPA